MDAVETMCVKHNIRGGEAELLRLISELGSVTCPKRMLAEHIGVSEMSVYRYARDLEAKGLISISGSDGAIKSYTITGIITETITSTITETITGADGSLARDIYIINGNNDNEIESSKTKRETELKRARRSTAETKPRTASESVFDEVWDGIDWVQKMRYGQTKEMQWDYSKPVLEEILRSVSPDTILKRIRDATGNGLSFGKPISYWLKDNKDMLMAREPSRIGWSKLGVDIARREM